MEFLKYENEQRESLDLSYSSKIINVKVDGLTSNNGIDNIIITINGFIGNYAKAYKEKLIKIFSPYIKGRFIYKDKYYIDCIPEKSPEMEKSDYNCNFQVNLICFTPYFISLKENKEIINGIKPLFFFPLNYKSPHIFGKKNNNEFNFINNLGNIKAGFKAIIKSNGIVRNPKIINVKTGEFIKLNIQLNKDDVFTINTISGINLYLEKNKNIYHGFRFLDDETIFFKLDLGENIIKIEASEGKEKMEVDFCHNDVLTGVV